MVFGGLMQTKDRVQIDTQTSPEDQRFESGGFPLRQHLPHLLRRAHFESEALFASIYGDEVTSRQLALLTAVDARPGASQSVIANAIGLDLNTCSDVVIRSVAKGLLRRERSRQDARMFALYLTDTGCETVANGRAKAHEYAVTASARLNDAEREQVVALLRKMLGFS